MNTLPFGRPMIDDAERNAVLRVLEGDILVHGPKAKEFEDAFAAYTGAPHAVSVGSCTAALHLAYFYLGLQSGDEVIVPAQTHNATAHAVELCGAKPVFVDAERVTGNIDIAQIERSITPRTKALSVVHFLGMPVDMEPVLEIAKRHRLFVVEDCALAIGTRYRGVHAGLLGDVGCFSFYPVKHMTTGEGGMILTKDRTMAETIRRQRAFGVDRTVSERSIPGIYDVTMLGFNYRMNEIAAAMGIEQLKKMPDFLKRRHENDNVLREELSSVKGISLLKSSHGSFQSSYYCFSILLDDSLAAKRFELVQYLKEQAIGTSVYYPHPVPHLTYYRKKYCYTPASFPNAAWISNSSVALPVGPHLTPADMVRIARAVREGVARLPAC